MAAMDNLDERFLVYSGLLLLCSTIAVFTGLQAGIWTFLQVATVIELLYWLALNAADETARKG
jgi:hypothetical protein